MSRSVWRALRVSALCLLGGCASPKCDPALMVAMCDLERRDVDLGIRHDTPTCDAIDDALGATFNQDLSNPPIYGGPPGGGPPGGE